MAALTAAISNGAPRIIATINPANMTRLLTASLPLTSVPTSGVGPSRVSTDEESCTKTSGKGRARIDRETNQTDGSHAHCKPGPIPA